MNAILALVTGEWQDMGDVSSIATVVLFVVAGLLLGYALRGLVGRWQAEAIEKKMNLRLDETESEVRSRLKEADITARATVVKAKEEFERSTKARRAELDQIEARLTDREAKLDSKSALLDERAQALEKKADDLASADERSRKRLAELDKREKSADERLQDLARMTHDEARRLVMERAEAEIRSDADSMARRIQEAARDEAERSAVKIVADAISRCATAHLGEQTTSSVILPNAEMKGRIVGRDGRNVRAFEAETGVTLLLDDAPDMVVLSCFDPLRREVARLALEALVADGRIHPATIEASVLAARGSVEKGNEEAGSEAASQVGVVGLSLELLRVMGSLRFRTSFSQNVLSHSVEVGLLAGAMASEMGLDGSVARRAGFLHDIGKAVTAEKKGAHASLGASLLKSHGESEEVCAAVAAHHGETPGGGVLGLLVAAADAISSARPGARQEKLSVYYERLESIESIARAHEGVQSVFAVQAGRDVRVMVDPGVVDDVAAGELARAICREISARVKFAGQIRVSVIRETRCVEYAK